MAVGVYYVKAWDNRKYRLKHQELVVTEADADNHHDNFVGGGRVIDMRQ